MRIRTAYCSACDRNVRVVVRSEVEEREPANARRASDLVCLEYGDTCTGDMCPLFHIPTEQMRENLAKLLGGDRFNGGH